MKGFDDLILRLGSIEREAGRLRDELQKAADAQFLDRLLSALDLDPEAQPFYGTAAEICRKLSDPKLNQYNVGKTLARLADLFPAYVSRARSADASRWIVSQPFSEHKMQPNTK